MYGIDAERRVEVPFQGTNMRIEDTQAVGLGYDEEAPLGPTEEGAVILAAVHLDVRRKR